MATNTLQPVWNPRSLTDLSMESSFEVTDQPVTTWTLSIKEKHYELKPPTGRWVMTMDVTAREVPAWMDTVMERLQALLELPLDWNGPNSPRIEWTTLRDAVGSLIKFMDSRSADPQVTPTVRGGLQFDWHENGIDLEIEFVPGKPDGEVLLSDRTGALEEWDGLVSQNLAQLISLFETRLHAGSER